MQNPIVQAKARYGHFLFFKNDDPIGACLRHYGEWAQQEINLFDLFLTESSTIADVGANIGTHSVYFSKKANKGRVISFEPQIYIFELLCANLLMNGCYNVVPVNAGVSNKVDSQRMVNFNPFVDNKVNYGEFKINDNTDKGILTNIVPLDKYIKSYNFDLIKLDVEGHEVEVIEGAKKIISKQKPTIYVEYNSNTGNQHLLDLLKKSGYRCYWHIYTKHNSNNFNGAKQNVWCEDGFVAREDNFHKMYEGNLICVHKSKPQPMGLPELGDQTNILDMLKSAGVLT